MGISIVEFRVAMETYGAKKLPDQEGSSHSVLVPCFAVGDVRFIHSGSRYIVQSGNKETDKTIDKTMAVFVEKHSGEEKEIHSIKGLLTLASMIEGKYSKELIDELTNTTYKKLLKCSLIQKNVEFPFQGNHSPKMKELYKKLAEYSNIVNPFGNGTVELKEPIEYLGNINLSIASKEGENPYARLTLKGRSSNARYVNESNGWYYDTMIFIQKNRKNGYISLGHYYINGNDNQIVDEVVSLYYKTNRNNNDDHTDDIDLRISLKTGKAWRTHKEEQAVPVTDEQIDIMITHLNISIKKIKQRIIRYMM